MKNKDKNDEPIYEVKGAGIFDKINGFEFNDEYEVEKRKSKSENTYKKFNGLSESQKIDVSNSFLKIYLRLIKVFISVVVGFTVIKAFMEHYMVVNDKLKERLEEMNTQNIVQNSIQNITDEEYYLDYSNEIYAKADTITFGEYGTIPTVVKYGGYDGYYDWGHELNDPRFKGNTSIYEIKYEALPNLDIFNYTRALERRNYKIVGQFEGEDIYLLEVDTNKFLFVIICEDYAIYGAGNGDYKTTFNLK